MGAIDGTLVNIKTPIENEHNYVDRHGNHSINVMVVAGPDLRVLYLSARWPGSVSDSRVFRNSQLYDRLNSGWRPHHLGYLIGDSGYANTNFLLTPLLNTFNEQQVRFNRAHKKTRRVVECTFGVMKQRFRCLFGPLPFEPLFSCEIIKCCVVLHNLALQCNPSYHVDEDSHEMDFTENEDAESEIESEFESEQSRRNEVIQLM